MTEEWKEVTGEQGKNIRWTEEPKDEKAREKTVYVGTVIEGVYENKRTGVGENGATIYEVRHAEHGLLSIWDTTVLADKMKKVAVGSKVRIEMTGTQKQKIGNKTYSLFKVFHAPAPMTEVDPGENELPQM